MVDCTLRRGTSKQSNFYADLINNPRNCSIMNIIELMRLRKYVNDKCSGAVKLNDAFQLSQWQ